MPLNLELFMRWIRPSGREIETNDNKDTIEYCKSLKWEPIDGPVSLEEEVPERTGGYVVTDAKEWGSSEPAEEAPAPEKKKRGRPKRGN